MHYKAVQAIRFQHSHRHSHRHRETPACFARSNPIAMQYRSIAVCEQAMGEFARALDLMSDFTTLTQQETRTSMIHSSW